MSGTTTKKGQYFAVVYSFGGGTTARTVTFGHSLDEVHRTFSRQNPEVSVVSIESETGETKSH